MERGKVKGLEGSGVQSQPEDTGKGVEEEQAQEYGDTQPGQNGSYPRRGEGSDLRDPISLSGLGVMVRGTGQCNTAAIQSAIHLSRLAAITAGSRVAG
jgi:hypothetical protein